MKRIKKWRYYCEFCKKSGASAYHIQRHEAHCTANPNRSCGFCAAQGNTPHPTAALVTALGAGDKSGMDWLAEFCEGCPACILTAIRAAGFKMEHPDCDLEGYFIGQPEYPAWYEWNFKEAKKEFWSNHRDANPYGF